MGVPSPGAAGSGWASFREPLPARWVERPLAVPLGWSSVKVRWQRKVSVSRFLPIGQTSLSPTWTLDRLSLEARYGLLSGVELGALLPLVLWSQSGAVGAIALDDPYFYVRIQPWRRVAPSGSMALDLGWRAPGGSSPTSEVPIHVGAHALVLTVSVRHQWGPFRLSVSSGATLRLSGYAGGVWRDPPDELGGLWEFGVQLGPAVVGSRWRWASLGPARRWLDGPRDLQPEVVEGSDSASLRASGIVIVQISRGFDLAMDVGGVVTARGPTMVGPEQLAPTGGVEVGAQCSVAF